MVKKFTFNFKFLDRFKKQSSDNDQSESQIDESNDETFDENDEVSTFKEMPKPNANSNDESPIHYEEDTEYESGDSSEDFAEKTLQGFQIPSQEEINQADISKDTTNPRIQFTDVDNIDDTILPTERPSSLKKFMIKFPNFNSESIKNLKNQNFSFKNSIGKIEKVSWTDLIQKLFSPYSRRRIHNLFIIFLVITLTYIMGKSTALFLNRTTKVEIKNRSTIAIPSESPDNSVTDINKITSANLFNAKEAEEVKAKGPKINIDEIICLDANRPTSSQLKLFDTIVLQDSVKSVASVQARGSQELTNIREGEKLDNYEVSKIRRMKLILKNLETGDCEYLASDKEGENDAPSPIKVLPPSAAKSIFKSMNPSIKNVGNNFKIKKKYRDDMVTKMSDILTQAKALQITNPDGTMCFKMTEVVPGSIYTQLNIQENDIVCNINGRKIDNLNELMNMLGRIKEIDSMQIGLKRNGINENLDYSFE